MPTKFSEALTISPCCLLRIETSSPKISLLIMSSTNSSFQTSARQNNSSNVTISLLSWSQFGIHMLQMLQSPWTHLWSHWLYPSNRYVVDWMRPCGDDQRKSSLYGRFPNRSIDINHQNLGNTLKSGSWIDEQGIWYEGIQQISKDQDNPLEKRTTFLILVTANKRPPAHRLGHKGFTVFSSEENHSSWSNYARILRRVKRWGQIPINFV
jgi:hypothetical protein